MTELPHLLERARHGVLLPEEGEVLATMVQAMADRLAELEEAHLQDTSAVNTVRALAERWTKYGSNDLRNAARILRMKAIDPHRKRLLPPTHIYLSTSCHHGEHAYCSSSAGHNTHGDTWTKTPGSCKWCSTPCVCACHRGDPTPR